MSNILRYGPEELSIPVTMPEWARPASSRWYRAAHRVRVSSAEHLASALPVGQASAVPLARSLFVTVPVTFCGSCAALPHRTIRGERRRDGNRLRRCDHQAVMCAESLPPAARPAPNDAPLPAG